MQQQPRSQRPDPPPEAVNGAPRLDGLDGAGEQTLADGDQSLADGEQTAADGEQTAADGDQTAADNDQAASDSDLEHGGDPRVHELSRDRRDRGAVQRQFAAQHRVAAAVERDRIATLRDLAAAARDRAAEHEDRALAIVAEGDPPDARARTAAEIIARAAEDRQRAAAARAVAAAARVRAARDREQAARDREQAAHDRAQARADREALLAHLTILETDQLTGARTRTAGLVEIQHEIDRARRAGDPLAAAYVDVVGLKRVNDTLGHAAGDALLQRAVRGIRQHLRSYDLIVRVGGDEFVCVMPGAPVDDARQRFGVIQRELAIDPDPCELRIGYSELAAGDGTADLIERADAQLHVPREP